MRLHTFAAVFTLGIIATGCAAQTEEDADVDDQGEVEGETQSEALVTKHHYRPIAPSIVWKPGCGAHIPNGPVSEMGLFLKFTRQYADLHVTRSTTVDNTTKVITVKLDTWSTGRVHPMIAVHPQEERIDANGTSMGVTYQTRVVDYRGRLLFSGTVRMIPAP